MKKTLFFIALPLGLFLNSCKNCETSAKPDLLHTASSFAFQTLTAPDPLSISLNVASTFLNEAEKFVGDCSCSENTEEAGPQELNWILAESNAAGDMLNTILDKNIPQSNLIACAEAITNIDMNLAKDAYFIIANILDIKESVNERLEDNNDVSNSRAAKMPYNSKTFIQYHKNKYGNNFKYQHVYVDAQGQIFDIDEHGTMKLISLK